MTTTNYFKNSNLILIADDDRSIRTTIRFLLENQGYSAIEAKNGQECLHLSQEYKPELILLDAVMPVMDGFSCCKELQDIFKDNCPPILMMTVLDDPQSIVQGFELGATDYVTKPILWLVLLQRIKKLLQNYFEIMQLKRQLELENYLKQDLNYHSLRETSTAFSSN